MNSKGMKLLTQLRQTGFGLGFILGGLFIGAVALWIPPAHAHDFKQGDLVIDNPYATPSLAANDCRQEVRRTPLRQVCSTNWRPPPQ